MFAFFQLFGLPAAMALGGAAVSVPIIIHLINRMRFRRVRWAAMEFLLKSQKRNRRRLIIEQLILLFLRCLMLALIGFLLAQFSCAALSGDAIDSRTTFHFVVLDDTLSMKDEWTDQGLPKSSFKDATERVTKIATDANAKGGNHQMRIVRMSQPKGQAVYEGPLADLDIVNVKNIVEKLTCSDLHASPKEAFEAAQAYFDQHSAAGQKVMYVVSDFRSSDWTGPQADPLTGNAGLVDALLRAKVRIDLIDTANPPRAETTAQADSHHDNIGITDFQSESRIVPVGVPVRMTMTVQNFAGQEFQNLQLSIKINGVDKHDIQGGDKDKKPPTISAVKANSSTTYSFPVTFHEPGRNLISVTLPKKIEVGLRDDDTRFAVVEVRDTVKTLVVTGDEGKGNDSLYLKTLIELERGQEVVTAGVEALERGGLEEYPNVFLVNVPEVAVPGKQGDRALKNLEAYVRQGGNLVTFLGERVVAAHWNDKMYNNGNGLLPVRLADSPTVEKWNEEQRKERRQAGQEYLFIRDPKHPALADAEQERHRFSSLLLWGFWPTEQPRDKWVRNNTNRLVEWATMANEKPIASYVAAGDALANKLDLPEDRFKKYLPSLKEHQSQIKDKLSSGKSLGAVAVELERLLNDVGSEDDPSKPNLKELFDLPEMKELRAEIESFREEIQYGAPLMLQHRFGNGRVVTFLTGVDDKWNNWASDGLVAPSWGVLMRELRRYLGSSETFNLIVGTPLEVELDATRYAPTVEVWYQTEPQRMKAAADAPEQPQQPVGTQAGKTKITTLEGAVENGRIKVGYAATEQPGAYHFVVTLSKFKVTDKTLAGLREDQVPEDVIKLLDKMKNQEFARAEDLDKELDKALGSQGQQFKGKVMTRARTATEERTYVCNVDTMAEGDLRRASPEDLERNNAGTPTNDRGWVLMLTGARKHPPSITNVSGTGEFSESPLVFLFLLIILIAEQMLAVHLSFHLRGAEGQAPPAATGMPPAVQAA